MRVLNILAVVAALSAATSVAAEPVARFTENGAFERPDGYREWVFIGATVQPRDINHSTSCSPGIKYTYPNRASYALWKETGTFRVGAFIVQGRAKDPERFLDIGGKRAFER